MTDHHKSIGHCYMVIEPTVLSIILGNPQDALGRECLPLPCSFGSQAFPCQESCTNHFRGTSPSEDREFDGCPTSMFDAGHPIRIDEIIDRRGHLMSLLEHLKKLYNKYIQILWLVLWRLCNWVKTTGYHKIAPTLKIWHCFEDRLMIGIAKCLSPSACGTTSHVFLSGGRKHERVEVWGGQSRRRWDQLHVPSVYTSCTFRNRGEGTWSWCAVALRCVYFSILCWENLVIPSNVGKTMS